MYLHISGIHFTSSTFFLFMKSTSFLSFVTGSLLLIASACSDNKPSEGSSVPKTPATTSAPAEKAKSCTLQSSSISSGTFKTESTYSYQGENLKQILSKRGEKTFTTLFAYDPQGRLDSVRSVPGESFLKYIYAPDGKLQEIKAGGSFMPRHFSYNDKGQMVTQQTLFNNKVYTSMEYTYDGANKPVALKVSDKDGQAEYSVEFKYDDKSNSALHTSVMFNALEMFYGYPVGNGANNVVEAVTTYHKKTAYTINGKHMDAGMENKLVRSYTYNQHGYPLTAQGNAQVESYVYNCR
jgi:hypothetical protein